MSLLIVLPVKSAPHYIERMAACEATWLKDSPIPHKGFTDADLGLIEINQHENATDPIRTFRTREMIRYAYNNGFDHVFRVDNDCYVWINRLLKSGFEKYDYMGWCLDIPQGPYSGANNEFCRTTAHGGIGFTLSRRAMKIVIDAPIEKYADGKYWGDLWAGHQLWKKGITCKQDSRFLDGSSGTQHHGNIFAEELPENHPYIAVHPVPAENMFAIHERFKDLPADTIAPAKQMWM